MTEPSAARVRPRPRPSRRPAVPAEVALTAADHDEVLRRQAARKLVAG